MSLSGFRFAESAKRETLHILKSSAKRFGVEAARRYRILIEQAVSDLVDEPDRAGGRLVDGRLHYHLRHSRNHVAGGKVREPRHILVCKIVGETLYVLAVGHDAMEEGLTRRIDEGEGR